MAGKGKEAGASPGQQNAAKLPPTADVVILGLGSLFAPCLLRMQWFVVGHDCGHRSFSKNKLVEDIVGTIAFMPLVYPFEPWRIKHNVHHAYTNK